MTNKMNELIIKGSCKNKKEKKNHLSAINFVEIRSKIIE